MVLWRLLACLAVLGASVGPAASAQEITADGGGGALALADCPTDLRYFNQLFGWQVAWPQEWDELRQADTEVVEGALDRWAAAPAALAEAQQALQAGRTIKAPRVVVARVLEQIDALEGALVDGPPLEGDVSRAARQRWDRLFRREIRPAVARYEAFLREVYLPSSSVSPGLGTSAEALSCFENSVERYTSLRISSPDIESIGQRLLNETLAELTTLYGRHESESAQVLSALRAERFQGIERGDIESISQTAIERARASLGRAFSRPLLNEISIVPLPAPMESSFPAGFYRPASALAPAAYVINLSRPEDRRLMAEVIAFHEALPGHHVGAALGYPEGEFNSGFVEGWGIYAEYLADELGLYSSDLDRAGMMAKHLWAASRLIVEPGLQIHGWSREQAIAFMREHTVLSDAEIALEVDRYIAMPGQSLSYMLGYNAIRDARADAERQLGPRFDLREFHDVVLGAGARPLNQVTQDVRNWIAAMLATPR